MCSKKWSAIDSIVGTVLFFLLIVLCVGDPDLIDALVHWIGTE